MQKDIHPRGFEIRGDKMTDIERACEYRCSIKPCKEICEYAALYVAGMNAGRKEREGEIKQVKEDNKTAASSLIGARQTI